MLYYYFLSDQGFLTRRKYNFCSASREFACQCRFISSSTAVFVHVLFTAICAAYRWQLEELSSHSCVLAIQCLGVLYGRELIFSPSIVGA